MKKLLVIAIAGLCFSSCNEEDKEKTQPPSAEAENCIPYSRDKHKSILDREVNAEIAQRCVDSLQKIFTQSDLGGLRQSYTASISFGSPALFEWMDTKRILVDTDSISLRLGAYTHEAIEAWGLSPREKYLGRTTAFIWPYKLNAGNLETFSDPFNIGSLHP